MMLNYFSSKSILVYQDYNFLNYLLYDVNQLV